MDENADQWVGLLFFLGFGLFMVVVMVPQFRVYWPQGQMFSIIGGNAVNPLFYQFAIICLVIMIPAALAVCIYSMLRHLHRGKREGSF